MPRKPSMVGVLASILETHASGIGVCIPAEVESFNRSDQTAVLRIVTKRSDGEARAQVPNAPVVFPGAYWDIQRGEGGILVIADEDWRTWWRTGNDSPPESVASHDLANAFFVPGLRSSPDSRTLGANATVLEKPAALGTVELGATGANKAAVHEDLLGDLNTFLGNISTWAATIDGLIPNPAPNNWATVVTPIVTILVANIAAGNYQSPSVMVED